jgi:hypothetical protein
MLDRRTRIRDLDACPRPKNSFTRRRQTASEKKKARIARSKTKHRFAMKFDSVDIQKESAWEFMAASVVRVEALSRSFGLVPPAHSEVRGEGHLRVGLPTIETVF